MPNTTSIPTQVRQTIMLYTGPTHCMIVAHNKAFNYTISHIAQITHISEAAIIRMLDAVDELPNIINEDHNYQISTQEIYNLMIDLNEQMENTWSDLIFHH